MSNVYNDSPNLIFITYKQEITAKMLAGKVRYCETTFPCIGIEISLHGIDRIWK